MTVELLRTLSLVVYIAAGGLFLVAVALFFLFNVPKLYGDISGRTAKKAIEAIRRQNESSGNKAYKPGAVNAERGKLTDKITQSGSLQTQTAGLSVSVGTEKLATSTLHPQTNETTVLEQASSETTVLKQTAGEPSVLIGALPVTQSGETTVLVEGEVPVASVSAGSKFTVDVEMSFTGSAEIIE